MATTYSTEANGPLNSTPATNAEGSVVGGRMRRFRASITLAAQAAADVIVLAEIPAGSVFAYGVLNTDTSLGSSTVAIGHSSDADIYRSAATFTATNTPTMFGRALGMAEGALSAATQVNVTIAAATMPASGKLVIDLYFSNG